jgi:DNA-binding NarL/FixJ family response regulator
MCIKIEMSSLWLNEGPVFIVFGYRYYTCSLTLYALNSYLPHMRDTISSNSLLADAVDVDATSFTTDLAKTIVLIADDHMLVRDGLKLLVAGILGDVQFLEAGDADSLLRMADSHATIQVGLVDLNMPGMERGFRLAELARRHPSLRLVVVSALTTPDVVRRTLEIPTVYAFVPKSASSDQMRLAIESAMQSIKLPYMHTLGQDTKLDAVLTPRLEQIRALLRQGMSNKLIASTLGISEGTVKNHMSEIFKVLHVSNRTQAAQIDSDSL